MLDMVAYAPLFELNWKFNLGLSNACWNDFGEDDGEQSHLRDYIKHAAACGSETNVKTADRFAFFFKTQKRTLRRNREEKSRAVSKISPSAGPRYLDLQWLHFWRT